MMKGGMFPPPVLLFSNGTALSPVEAIRMRLRPYVKLGELKLMVLTSEEVLPDTLILIKNLDEGKGIWPGFRRAFGTTISLVRRPLVTKDPYGYQSLVKEVPPNADLVLAVIPDEEMVPYEEDPYMPLKRRLSSKGIPSQMVTFSTVESLRDKGYVLLNIALSLYAKAGGVPWVLTGRPSWDLLIGLDTSPGCIGMTLMSDWHEWSFRWDIRVNPEVEVIQILEDVLQDNIIAYVREKNLYPRRIVIHRDGLLFEEEIEQITRSLHKLQYAGILPRDMKYYLIEVRKRNPARFIRMAKAHAYTPEKGTFLQLGDYRYLINTTGYPDLPPTLALSPPRPITVELVETNDWEINFYTLAKQTYWLTALHYASAFVTPKLPISTLYPDRIASFWSAGVHPSANLRTKLWFL